MSKHSSRFLTLQIPRNIHTAPPVCSQSLELELQHHSSPHHKAEYETRPGSPSEVCGSRERRTKANHTRNQCIFHQRHQTLQRLQILSSNVTDAFQIPNLQATSRLRYAATLIHLRNPQCLSTFSISIYPVIVISCAVPLQHLSVRTKWK